MRRARRRCIAALCSGLAAIALAGCLGRDEAGGGPPVPAPPADAKVVDVDWLKRPTGPVVYCTYASPGRRAAVDRFNHAFEARGLRATIQRLSFDTRKQRQSFLHGSPCDVYDSDVVWMAEWAARGRVYSMRPYIRYVNEQPGRTFIPNTLETAKFAGRFWGVPHTTNAGFLFYRNDAGLSRADRATWRGVYRAAKANHGIDYQGIRPESLTVSFLEIAFAAGGRVLSRDGRRSVIDSPANIDALRFMVDGIKEGAAPRDVLRHDALQTRKAFRDGATFMRNWPENFNELARTPIARRYAVAPLPIFDGAGVAGVLGGANLVIDAQANNPVGALALIDFLVRPQQQKDGLTRHAEPAVLEQTYRDPDVRRSVPFANELYRAIRQGRPRPVSPTYYKISDPISRNVYDALSRPDRVSPEQALERAGAEIDEALASAAKR
jgi:multiple sugar transport system substrate-binding protein